MTGPISVLADRLLRVPAELVVPPFSLQYFDGEPDPAQLATADALLCRSTLKVGEALLRHSPVRFVGTATAGIDHLDVAFLEHNGIHWVNAPGCNANAVVDYVMATIASQFDDQQLLGGACRVGVIGGGQVGGRLAGVLDRLEIPFLVYDPFIDAGENQVDSLEALAGCEVLSLHVPLTTVGEYATQGMVDQAMLSGCHALSLLINASRAGVIAPGVLQDTPSRCSLALDVWPGEPFIDPQLVQRCAIATPHVAGHSAAGKLRGVVQVIAALASHYGVDVPDYPIASAEPLPQPLTPGDYRQRLASKFDLVAMSDAFKAALLPALELDGDAHAAFVHDQFVQYRQRFAGRDEFDYPPPTGQGCCDAQ